MQFSAKCNGCGSAGVVNKDFEMRGKYGGFPVLRCNACGRGMQVVNAGSAIITKRAKTRLIAGPVWTAMCASWLRTFPEDGLKEATSEHGKIAVDIDGVKFEIGDRIENVTFGNGTIIDVNPGNEATIVFDNGDRKNISVGSGKFLKKV